MIAMRSFIDTNILVYTDNNGAPDKQAKAQALLEDLAKQEQGVISTQVLQEYFAATTRKLKTKPGIARQKVEIFASMDILPITVDLILGAIDVQQLHRLSFWDALIVQAALFSQCRVLYSEDMNAGQNIRGLKIVNPFA